MLLPFDKVLPDYELGEHPDAIASLMSAESRSVRGRLCQPLLCGAETFIVNCGSVAEWNLARLTCDFW